MSFKFTLPKRFNIKNHILAFFDRQTIIQLFASIIIYIIYAKVCQERLMAGFWINVIPIFLLLRIKRWWKWIAIGWIVSTYSINLACGYLYRSSLKYGMLASALETNHEEASGFLSFAGFIPWLFPVLLLLIFFYLTRNNKGLGKIGIFVLCVSLIYPAIRYVLLDGRVSRRIHEIKTMPIDALSMAYRRSILLKDSLTIIQYFHTQATFEKALTTKRHLPDGITPPHHADTNTIPQQIVFILGESDSKRHHEIYGYNQPTDPFLRKVLKETNKAETFNAISSASMTREAVPRLLTFATARNFSPYLENSNILEMAKMAGYSTYWLSKQANIGVHDTVIRAITQNADYSYFNLDGLSSTLEPIFAKYMDASKRQFFVLHIYGSHMNYANRHTEDDYQQVTTSEESVRHYDATIIHTNRFLEAINKLADKNTLFIYLSDHGEVVNKGHGYPGIDARGYEIPFVVWSKNPAILSKFKESVRKYSTLNGKLFNTSSFPVVIAETMGFSVSRKFQEQQIEEANYFFDAENQSQPISLFWK